MKKIFSFTIICTIAFLLTGCLKDEKATEYKDYIKAAMDASYLGRSETYLVVAKTTKEDAEELYDQTAEYLAYSIMKYNSVPYDDISEETINKYKELAKKALEKSKYTINDGRKVDGVYQVKVEITPIDLWEATYDEVEDYIDEFLDKYPNYQTMAGDELLAAKEEYANKVLEILNPYVEDMKYKDTVSKIVEIQFDDDGLYGISQDDWDDIDDYVMGIK
ncbi:MAG: hypothetical protein HFI87_07805 [Bacilli bacterium]|nr:hypothetical protein [Bacilli bacterium]